MQIAHGDRRTMTSEQDRGPWSQRLTAPCTAERTLGGRLGRISGKMPLVGLLTGWAILLEVSPMGTVLGGGGVCEILVVGKCNRNGVGVVGVSPRQMRYFASVLFSLLLRYSASGTLGCSELWIFSFCQLL